MPAWRHARSTPASAGKSTQLFLAGAHTLGLAPARPQRAASCWKLRPQEGRLADRLRTNAYKRLLNGFTKEAVLARTVAAFQSPGFWALGLPTVPEYLQNP